MPTGNKSNGADGGHLRGISSPKTNESDQIHSSIPHRKRKRGVPAVKVGRVKKKGPASKPVRHSNQTRGRVVKDKRKREDSSSSSSESSSNSSSDSSDCSYSDSDCEPSGSAPTINNDLQSRGGAATAPKRTRVSPIGTSASNGSPGDHDHAAGNAPEVAPTAAVEQKEKFKASLSEIIEKNKASEQGPPASDALTELYIKKESFRKLVELLEKRQIDPADARRRLAKFKLGPDQEPLVAPSFAGRAAPAECGVLLGQQAKVGRDLLDNSTRAGAATCAVLEGQ